MNAPVILCTECLRTNTRTRCLAAATRAARLCSKHLGRSAQRPAPAAAAPPASAPLAGPNTAPGDDLRAARATLEVASREVDDASAAYTAAERALDADTLRLHQWDTAEDAARSEAVAAAFDAADARLACAQAAETLARIDLKRATRRDPFPAVRATTGADVAAAQRRVTERLLALEGVTLRGSHRGDSPAARKDFDTRDTQVAQLRGLAAHLVLAGAAEDPADRAAHRAAASFLLDALGFRGHGVMPGGESAF